MPTPEMPTTSDVSGNPARLPAEILDDFDAGCAGLADIDMRGVLWEVIADLIVSGSLYLSTVYPEAQVAAFRSAMEDYAANHYGDD